MKVINKLGYIHWLLVAVLIGLASCDSSDEALYTYSRENPTMPDFSLTDDDDDDDDDSAANQTAPEQENPAWSATIYPNNYFGVPLKSIYFDLKCSPGASNTLAKAQTYFHEDNMNGVRIPIFGTSAAPAHPSAGEVVESYYTTSITSVNYAKQVRGNRDFTVFASKKLNGSNSFPDWVIDDDGYIVPDLYATLLFDFINYMDTQGITIDVLGIDNENEFNKGNIDPHRHYLTTCILRDKLKAAGLKIPTDIGPDRYNINSSGYDEGGSAYQYSQKGWMEDLLQTYGDKTAADFDYVDLYDFELYSDFDYANYTSEYTYKETLDIYGVHYYPSDVTKFPALVNNIGAINSPVSTAYPYLTHKGYDDYGLHGEHVTASFGYGDNPTVGRREFWATEPHWNDEGKETTSDANNSVLSYMGYTIGAVWDSTDLGLDNIMWWEYSRTGNTRGNIMYAMTIPIYGAQPVHIVDHDGEPMRTTVSYSSATTSASCCELGLLHTRAFRNGNKLVVYMLNTCQDANVSKYTDYTNYKFTLDPDSGMKFFSSTAPRQQWRDDALIEGETIDLQIYDENTFYVDIPIRSFTMVTLDIVDM